VQQAQVRYKTRSHGVYNTPGHFYKETKKSNKSESKNKLEIDYDNLITEDDEPVDNFFSEFQQTLLKDSLSSSWEREEPFLVVTNVGIYEEKPTTPIVPDVLLSLNVKPAHDIWKKKNRCYFISIFGKPPELVIELVSNKVGNEIKTKRKRYEKMGVKYYIIYDPGFHIKESCLHAFKLEGKSYKSFSKNDLNNKQIWFKDLSIGLKVHKEIYKGLDAQWLRWCYFNGKLLKTGNEKKDEEKMRADKEKMRADKEKMRADKEKMRADKEKMRAEAAEKELALLRALLLKSNNSK